MRHRFAVALALAVLLAGCADHTSMFPIPATFPNTGLVWARVPHDEAVLGGPGDQQMLSVATGGPGLVAVGHDRSNWDAAVWVSADGYTWDRIDEAPALGGPGDQQMLSVVAGGPGLVAVGFEFSGEDDDAAVWVSADGYTWDRVPHDEAVFGGPGLQHMSSVVVGGPGLVVVGFDRSEVRHSSAAVWVSADGYTWDRIDDDIAFGGPGDQHMSSVVAGR